MTATYIVREAKSMTGVPVIPSGSMLPHGMSASGTGVPSVWLQTCWPDEASSAYTVSALVTTMTRSVPPGPLST